MVGIETSDDAAVYKLNDEQALIATTDFFMAVKAEPAENVVFSWITWPDKETRDRGNKAAMADPRFEAFNAPNGWGLYIHFVPFVEAVLAACEEHPDATIRVSR